jgi:Leucine-rich repeat (LRR) protein
MISQPKKLKQLNINTARLHHLPKNVFLHLKNLETLVLYGNRITNISKAGEVENSLLIADAFIFPK